MWQPLLGQSQCGRAPPPDGAEGGGEDIDGAE